MNIEMTYSHHCHHNHDFLLHIRAGCKVSVQELCKIDVKFHRNMQISTKLLKHNPILPGLKQLFGSVRLEQLVDSRPPFWRVSVANANASFRVSYEITYLRLRSKCIQRKCMCIFTCFRNVNDLISNLIYAVCSSNST